MSNARQNLKKSKSFEQNSMQLASDGTKPKNGGGGYGGGLAG